MAVYDGAPPTNHLTQAMPLLSHSDLQTSDMCIFYVTKNMQKQNYKNLARILVR